MTLLQQTLQKVGIAAFAVLLSFFAAHTAFAADTALNAKYLDVDEDGTVDHIRIEFDENIDGCTHNIADWSIDTAGTINVSNISGIASDPEGDGNGVCDGTDAFVYLQVSTTANRTGGDTDPEISYTNNGRITGTTTGALSSFGPLVAGDAAAPAFISSDPVDASSGAPHTTDVAISFTEPMDTGFVEGTEFTISPDPGGVSASWNGTNTMVTLDFPLFACGVTYTVTTDETEIDAALGTVTQVVTTGDIDGDFSFTTRGTGCSSASVDDSEDVDEEPESYEIDLASISDMEVGDFYTLTWDSSLNITLVDLFYSVDGGDTYTQIADNTENDGSYKWSVPDFDGSMTVKIEATDLASVLATDTESATQDDATEEDPTEDDTTEEEDVSDEVAPAWDVEGVEPGDLVRGETLSTVYYITDTYERRPFINEQAFFTWYDDFDSVETIADEDLAAFDLGGLMLPQAGTVLVKIESDARVYALSEGDDMYSPFLHAIDSEEDAQELWGSDWADYVIDIPSTFFTRFGTGDIVNPDYFEVDMDTMKKRVELN